MAKSGSSDCLSRSPAVTSMAMGIPPVNMAITRKNGMVASSMAARLAGVDTSSRSTASGSTTEGWMPRTTSRWATTWLDHAASRCSAVIVAGRAWWRDSSTINFTGAGCPARSFSPKSGGMTITTGTSPRRTASSGSAGASTTRAPCSRKSTRFGALARPATGISTPFSSACREESETRNSMTMTRTGPSTGKKSAVRSALLSRSPSRISFESTIQNECSQLMRAPPRSRWRPRGRPPGSPDRSCAAGRPGCPRRRRSRGRSPPPCRRGRRPPA